ncbi:hypothetical protein [Streptomyces sp.]|nr:hypothetical protein [Streptomyces sp.]HZF91723.1 hypothetical protein [Streptomyces sp.]
MTARKNVLAVVRRTSAAGRPGRGWARRFPAEADVTASRPPTRITAP